MHPLQRTLLRAKHWELFCLWLLLRTFASMASITLKHHSFHDFSSLPPYLFLSVVRIFDFVLVFAWSYGVGTFANSLSPRPLRLSPKMFFLAGAGCLALAFSPDHWYRPLSWTIFLNLLLWIICFGYVIRFPAKALLTAEFQESSKFEEYFGYLIGVFAFPIGIWFLQPKVNQLLARWHVFPSPPDAIPLSAPPSI
jgi:hypothetical protein